MHMPASETQRIVCYIRKQADNCLEVSRGMPSDYLIDSAPREMWHAIAGALESVAAEIESGRHLYGLQQ